MAGLVLGPLVRYAGTHDATVWVETGGPCTAEVRADGAPPASERTFCVAGHHYALVHVEGLEPETPAPYEVLLDGERVWPEADSRFPPSVIRTHGGPGRAGPTRIMFGSCRVCAPDDPPYSLSKDQDDRGREVDALVAQAQRMMRRPPEEWPQALLLLGDQVYADEVSPGVRELIRSRRDPEVPPGETVADFEEYTQLYRESWSDPTIRWLLSTVPTAMIFDDHDVHDDWNTSLAWVLEMRAKGWWDRRIAGGFMSYLVYQHWGNLSPEHLAQDGLFQEVRGSEDATRLLQGFAYTADRQVEGTRWSFCRDIGPARVVMIDSRAGRVLRPGARAMIDPHEWAWIEEHATGGFDHLLIGSSLPLFLSPALHDLEAWNEAICDGAWGRVGAWAGEKVRQRADLEHWAAFRDSFERMCGLFRAIGTGERGEPPATIVALSGDVHHAYLAEVGFPRGTGMRSTVWQATCSPFRNPLDKRERRSIRFAFSRAAAALGRAFARSAGVPRPPVRWRFVHGEPWFDNQIGALVMEGRRASFVLEKTLRGDGERGELRLEQMFDRELTPG
jgi:hypothetical protein